MVTGIFIGDEVSAVGFRLAGLSVRVPQEGHEAAALEEAVTKAELVLITAEIASRIPQEFLDQTMAATQPLVCVLPDVRRRAEPQDFAAEIRTRLGIGEEITRDA